MKKPDATTTDTRNNQATQLGPTIVDSLSGPHRNFFQQTWAKIRSWFEVPFGYEDETGFHYGQEPTPVQAGGARSTFREVFTDRACDTAMFMAATSTDTSPAPDQSVNAKLDKRDLTVNLS